MTKEQKATTNGKLTLEEMLSELGLTMQDYYNKTNREHTGYDPKLPPRLNDRSILFCAHAVAKYKTDFCLHLTNKRS